MPVIVQNTEFYDNFGGGPFPSYRGNAGDRQNVRITIWSSIRINSLTDPLTLDPSTNQITCNTTSWLTEGFRVGDTLVATIYSPSGAVIITWNTSINFVTDNVIDIGSVPQWYDFTAGQFIRLEVPSQVGRGDLDFFFNHVLNSTPGTEFSLIDGEATRVRFNDLNALAIGANQIGDIIGNQSGQYLISGSINRNADPGDNQKSFTISVDFTNSGIYDQDWFQSSDCLKIYTKYLWSREPGDSDNIYSFNYSALANTGWFDEPRNSDIVDSTLIQGITSEVDYCKPSTHTIIVDGPLTGIGIGASYVPLDETYYKNKPQSQKNLGIISATSLVSIPLHISANNPQNAGYTITIDSVSSVGSETTIEFTFTPNPNFNLFFQNREDGDRLFYFWVKCGNINHLIFQDQLTCEPPVGDPLVLEVEKAFYDHSQNVNDDSPTDLTITFNTEDDLGFYGSFLLDKGKVYTNFSSKVEAFNTSTEEDFTLLLVNFDFTGVQISNDGRYLLNETIAITTSLPTTSLKREAYFTLEPSLDTPTQYGVKIYFPFLLRWEYWLPQTNASVDFYPNQNKNWQQYSGTAPWSVRMELNLQEPLLSHLYAQEVIIKDYDSEIALTNSMELIRDLTNQVVGVIVEGEIMRITAYFELNNGNVWDQVNIWGMITAEPYESGPRWICSSVVPFDNNVLNPLTPLSGDLIQITFPAPNIAKLECFFDSNKINLQNGVKFTGKIKGCQGSPELVKTTTSGDTKTTTFGDTKTIAY